MSDLITRVSATDAVTLKDAGYPPPPSNTLSVCSNDLKYYIRFSKHKAWEPVSEGYVHGLYMGKKDLSVDIAYAPTLAEIYAQIHKEFGGETIPDLPSCRLITKSILHQVEVVPGAGGYSKPKDEISLCWYIGDTLLYSIPGKTPLTRAMELYATMKKDYTEADAILTSCVWSQATHNPMLRFLMARALGRTS